MRTINDIQSEILGYQQEVAELTTLEVLTTEEISVLAPNSDSKVAFWRRWIRIIAKAIWAIEVQFDLFRSETNTIISASRIHTREWYREQALAYQHGFMLVGLNYENTGYSESQILVSKIVKHASVVKYVIFGRGVIRMKLGKQDLLGNLQPLNTTELNGFKAYINKITDAGTTIVATSGNHDDLKLELDIYYDATILDNQGQRLDGTNNTPVKEAINQYLKALEFDGRFIKTKLTDTLQNVSGIVLPNIKNAWSKYGNYLYTDSYINVGLINEIRTADAGYFTLDEATTIINYIPYSE